MTVRKTNRLLLISSLLPLAVGLLVPESALADYATQGALTMNTEGGPYVNREIPWSTQLELADQDVSIGGAGENATAAYSVSIIDAAVSASTSAQNAPHAPGDYWTASAQVPRSQFSNDLRFTVPAGSYPAGLYSVMRIRASASAGASTGATADYTYEFTFGSGYVYVHNVAPAENVSGNIDLTDELVPPGTTYPTPVTRLKPFSGFVDSRSGAPGEFAQSASSDVSISVVCLMVPAGVTWTSDAGVFNPPDCDPDTDSDGIPDSVDNCTLIPNADQRDSNGDGYGNVCDADVNNDGIINVIDLGLVKVDFFATGDLDTDFNGDGVVNVIDLGILKAAYFGPPGPSGIAP